MAFSKFHCSLTTSKISSSGYRPLSVINIDYKLYTLIIEKRYEHFMNNIINEDQTSFIKSAKPNITKGGPYISLNMLHITMLMQP